MKICLDCGIKSPLAGMIVAATLFLGITLGGKFFASGQLMTVLDEVISFARNLL